MRENYQLKVLSPDQITIKAHSLKNKGARLCQICSVRTKEGFDLLYSYVLGYEFKNYKISIAEDAEIESITAIFPNAFLYENEMSELFGIKIKYISLDYKNKLYDIAVETPFK